MATGEMQLAAMIGWASVPLCEGAALTAEEALLASTLLRSRL